MTMATAMQRTVVCRLHPSGWSSNVSHRHAHTALRPAVRPSHSRQMQRCRAAESKTDEDEELAIEKQLALRKKKKGPKVVAPLVDATRSGQPITKEQQLETNIVFCLFCLFTLILLLGLLLAGSGFLSESIDDFAQTYIYPAYSPLVVFFLLCSSAYGYWKTRS